MKKYVPTHDQYESKICLSCPLVECESAAASGCEVMDSRASDKKEIYFFIARSNRKIDDIINLGFGDEFTHETLIMLERANLVKYKEGLWLAKK